jgi:hypothetical protein
MHIFLKLFVFTRTRFHYLRKGKAKANHSPDNALPKSLAC